MQISGQISLLGAYHVNMSARRDSGGTFCHRTSSTGAGHTRITFLRTAAGTRTLLLYVSEWSEEKLVKCTIKEDPSASSSYLSFCRQTRSDGRVQISELDTTSMLLGPGSLCSLMPVSDILDQQNMLRTKTRGKRALIFPGTLWCGTGSKAIDYNQLGMFERADRCCREHDHCASIIPTFTVNYGVFNSNFFTVSHCECDQRFRRCLQSVNDSISNMVGFSFFNLLKVPCFEFTPRSQCVEFNWWGTCQLAKVAPYAVLKNSLFYSINSNYSPTSDPQSPVGTGTNLVKITPLSSRGTRKIPNGNHPKSIASTQDCVHRGPSRGDTFKIKHRKRCNRGKKTSTQTTTTSQTNTRPTKINALLKLTTTSLILTTMSKKYANATKAADSKSDPKTAKHKSGSSTENTISSSQRNRAAQKARSNTTEKTASTSRLTPSPQPQRTWLTTTLLSKRPRALGKPQLCGPTDPPRGDTFLPQRGRRRKSCLQPTTGKPPSPTNISPTKMTASITRGTIFETTPASKTSSPTAMTTSTLWKNTSKTAITLRTTTVLQSPSERASAWTTDSLRVCRPLKHLDDCKHRIPPSEKRYDLHNTESKTVYHCNCIRRLAGLIRVMKSPNILNVVLQDFVSPLCLNMSSVKHCLRGKSCTAGLSKAIDLIQVFESTGESKGLSQSTSKNKKRQTPVRLYKRCLRITEPRTHRLI
ncbi:hypothetical protein DPEC_G00264070 [Dallia pectoralis]|uniref:Uncharacterized protein n=1 Tax=Dallia pectoralis TaxID=75939 RepID=A0ACC2FSF1_DALPE|nr:hypothetical protein DPEC_G00264070 [Dallia pectoralis]